MLSKQLHSYRQNVALELQHHAHQKHKHFAQLHRDCADRLLRRGQQKVEHLQLSHGHHQTLYKRMVKFATQYLGELDKHLALVLRTPLLEFFSHGLTQRFHELDHQYQFRGPLKLYVMAFRHVRLLEPDYVQQLCPLQVESPGLQILECALLI